MLTYLSGLSRSGQVGENTLKVWFWYDPQQVSNPCLLFGRPPPLSLQLPLGGRMIPFNGKRNMVLDHRESFYLSERNCREVTSSFQLQKFSMWITWWSSFFFLFYCCSFLHFKWHCNRNFLLRSVSARWVHLGLGFYLNTLRPELFTSFHFFPNYAVLDRNLL